MTANSSRVDAEWLALNAFRELIKVASKGDDQKATYDNALGLGGALCPTLLGTDSMLRRARETDTTREYRQKARLLSIKQNQSVEALGLVRDEIHSLKELIAIEDAEKGKVDQLKRKLNQLVKSEAELDEKTHTEHQLIFRDAYNVDRGLKSLYSGQGYRDFSLTENTAMRVRVLHPDKPEHITGADLIYERHSVSDKTANIAAVQYKIWEDKLLYLSDARFQTQLCRLKAFLCEKGFCAGQQDSSSYRFPFCAAFLRPTDKLQGADQKFLSTGEHLPICRIQETQENGPQGGARLSYEQIRDVSLTGDAFEYLFNRGKIGSRILNSSELQELYANSVIAADSESITIYVQEFGSEARA